MKTCIVSAPFDPVTNEEIRRLLNAAKVNGFRKIYLYASEEGILPRRERIRMLKLAIRPWRRLELYEGSDCPENMIPLNSRSEAVVRQGRYDLAAPGIKKILIEEGPYLSETLDHLCSPHRAAHSRSVAMVCRQLAEAHGMDADQAWRAGMMHDMTKGFSDEANGKIMKVYAPEMMEYSPKVWHSYTAPVYLYHYLGLRDHKILEAIRHHTLADGTGDLDRILYIADKIEPSRGYDASKEMELSRQDLKKGAELVLAESKQYMREKEGLNV